jgi:hypothetical protein
MARTQVDCVGCHRHRALPESVAEVVGQTFAAANESCTYCHGSKYDGTLDEWRERLAGLEEASDGAYQRAAAIVSGATLPASALQRAEALLDDAEHNRRLVHLGHGVHNINYAAALLNVAIEFCQASEAIVSAEAADVLLSDEVAGSPVGTARGTAARQDEQ